MVLCSEHSVTRKLRSCAIYTRLAVRVIDFQAQLSSPYTRLWRPLSFQGFRTLHPNRSTPFTYPIQQTKHFPLSRHFTEFCFPARMIHEPTFTTIYDILRTNFFSLCLRTSQKPQHGLIDVHILFDHKTSCLASVSIMSHVHKKPNGNPRGCPRRKLAYAVGRWEKLAHRIAPRLFGSFTQARFF